MLDNLDFAKAIGLAIKIFALMTPTAVLSYFISHTHGLSWKERFAIACKTGLAIFIIGEVLFLFGSPIFTVFGFTIDAFRIGVGILLFLSAIKLMNGEDAAPPPAPGSDISVVPLAIPLGMGPSAIGWVMVLGSDIRGAQDIIIATACLFIASLWMLFILCFSEFIRKVLGKTGIAIMAKLTALILSAIAAQVIFTGIKAFLHK